MLSWSNQGGFSLDLLIMPSSTGQKFKFSFICHCISSKIAISKTLPFLLLFCAKKKKRNTINWKNLPLIEEKKIWEDIKIVAHWSLNRVVILFGNLVIPWFAESYNSYGTVTQLREALQSQVEIFILFKTFPILLTFFTFLQHCRNKRHFIFTDIFIDTCHIYWYFVILTMEWEKCSSFKESYKITSKPSLTK